MSESSCPYRRTPVDADSATIRSGGVGQGAGRPSGALVYMLFP
jgi:hypothetical protein